MKVGVADYGMNVWFGGCHDIEERLERLKSIGYDGVERLEATSADQALETAARFRQLGASFATCRGPNPACSLQWSAALGCTYVWAASPARDLDTFCRQVSDQCRSSARWGVRVALHNHMGTPVETEEQLETFLAKVPEAWLLLDTAHLAATGGDAVGVAKRHASRIISLHVKDWVMSAPDEAEWFARGRFCELGEGNIGLDNAAVVTMLRQAGYDGWVLVEQDTHLRDPYDDLVVSREYLRRAGV